VVVHILKFLLFSAVRNDCFEVRAVSERLVFYSHHFAHLSDERFYKYPLEYMVFKVDSEKL
jgi:hypothetical protein